jgi:hypothetical protein
MFLQEVSCDGQVYEKEIFGIFSRFPGNSPGKMSDLPIDNPDKKATYCLNKRQDYFFEYSRS